MVTQLDRARGPALSSFLPLGNMRKTGSGYVAIYEVLPGIGCREGRDGMARTWLTVKDPLTSSAEHIPAKLHLVMRNHLA